MRRLLTALSLTVLVTAAVPATAPAKPSQETLFEAPRELLGDDAGLRAQTLDELRSFGVDRLRLVLYWHDVAPDADRPGVPRIDERDPAAYDLTRYDRAIGEARQRGFRLLLTLSGPVPRWATRDRADTVTRPSATRFGRFAEAMGRHYRDDVDAWSIWNEPNHPQFLQPQWSRSHDATSARIYRQLFRHGEAGLRRSGNAGDTILLGETAPRGTGKVVHPITFLRRTLCLNARWRKRRGCGALAADGYAHHAYTTKAGPFFVPPNRADVTIGVLSRLQSALARAERAGALPRRTTPLWLTEFGIQSEPDPFLGVSQTAQAEYRAISERIAFRNPRVVAFSQYLMRDDAPIATSSRAGRYAGFESGLRGHGGDAKRAYEAFRVPLVAIRGRRATTLWGLVRPATAVTTVRIEHRGRRGPWRLLKHDRTDARGAWSTTTRKVAGRRYRVRWTAPDGTTTTGPLTRAYASA